MPPLWTHHTIATNGIRLHYVAAGEGPLMLLLHGFPEFWYSWRHQIPEFAQAYRVVALDLRGYNESDKPQATRAYQMRELVEDVRGVITGLGYEHCVLVGHDWGGAIAWTFAYEHPELLQKLVVMNLPHPAKFTAALQSNPQQWLRSWYILLFQLPGLPEWLLQWDHYAALTAVFRDQAVDKRAFTEADLAAYRQAAAKPGALTAMLNYYRNLDVLWGRTWGRLDVPTLLIWGEADVALGKELTAGTHEYVREFYLRYIPRCSHWVQQEQPDAVNQYLWAFLRGTLATGYG
ncbi:MAG: alpha/beta hydrolase [Spirulinaceae cyanobacterium RM2_2_10]|nr:alpha/beta hydrolase [Spirulinaceae cyanobacterium SM2_1_0]NJO19895.1 alpha/beta hydrolase [Spirulinaceae cyanobacterium RM2_2_10]